MAGRSQCGSMIADLSLRAAPLILARVRPQQSEWPAPTASTSKYSDEEIGERRLGHRPAALNKGRSIRYSAGVALVRARSFSSISPKRSRHDAGDALICSRTCQAYALFTLWLRELLFGPWVLDATYGLRFGCHQGQACGS